MTPPSGYLLLDKPRGRSSAWVTRRIGHLAGAKAGHLGTLDPMATGLLVVCVGNALKLVPYLQKGTKRYLAEVTFGKATDTYDAEGNVTRTGKIPEDLHARVRKAIKRFSGTVLQAPPPYSAIKVDGERLYKRARKGEEVELKEREVTFYEVRILNLRADAVVLDVTCSAGTYIRSLAHDLGKAVRCPACLSSLRRTESRPFTVENAVSLEELEAGTLSLAEAVQPMERFLPALPRIDLTPTEAGQVRNGVPLPGVRVRPGPCLLFAPDGTLLAVGESSEEKERVSIRRVVATT
jgi:tRNA pseudouridine55 synthase